MSTTVTVLAAACSVGDDDDDDEEEEEEEDDDDEEEVLLGLERNFGRSNFRKQGCATCWKPSGMMLIKSAS